MAKGFKLSNDMIMDIGGLLLQVVPEIVKLFGKKRSKGDLVSGITKTANTIVNKLTPLAKVKPDEIRRVAKFFETLGGVGEAVTSMGADNVAKTSFIATGGTFRSIADTLIAFKANKAAGPAADFHLDQAVQQGVIVMADGAARLASELFTVADLMTEHESAGVV